MSLPSAFAPFMDRESERRAVAAVAEPKKPLFPAIQERVYKSQEGMLKDSLAEKPLPNHKPLPDAPKYLTLPGQAWRKMFETVRPCAKKKRRAKEFDAVMRREIENPVGTSWITTTINEKEEEGEGSMIPILEAIQVEKDELTALPTMPVHMVRKSLGKKKSRKLVKKAKSTMF